MGILIEGIGTYIPDIEIPNAHFLRQPFYDARGQRILRPGEEVVQKFEEITGIKTRRYARPEQVTSDLATEAARQALADAGLSPDELHYIVVAHNFGDVRPGQGTLDMVPALAARVAHHLAASNPRLVTYDLAFGCPGWIEAVISVLKRIQDGEHALVIGAEALSRVYDPYDRDSMIFSDGAGAVVLTADAARPGGFLAHLTRSYAGHTTQFLNMGPSYRPGYAPGRLFMHMQGRKVYEFALKEVPMALKAVLDQAGLRPEDLRMVLIHQANAKMDEAILRRFLKLYGLRRPPRPDYMPMTIHFLGNSSVATIPTMMALIKQGQLPPFSFEPGDIVLMTSVGAGMNINAALYQFPPE